MPETVESLTLLQQVEARKNEEIDALAAFVEKRIAEREAFEAREASETAKPTDEERSAFAVAEEEYNKERERREAALATLETRVAEQVAIEKRRQAAAAKAASPTISDVREPLTYRKDNARDVSYFRDMAARYHNTFAAECDDVTGAMERLDRHGKEMADQMVKRDAAREQRAQEQIERAEQSFTGSFVGGHRRGLDVSPFERRGRAGMEQRTNPNRTDGQGGYFVPPLWLIDEYIPYLRAGRVAAGLCRQMDLPAGTDSINIPKLSTSTLTGVQTADNQAVTSQDFTDTSVSAGVKTIAGQEDVAIQLIEQSPGQIIDQVVMQDLLADYNKQLDLQVLTGTNANGQVDGILPVGNWSGANTVTWTSANPAGFVFNQALGAAVSKIAYNRFDLSGIGGMLHPRRWFWFATAGDDVGGASPTNRRPLVNAANGGFLPYNTVAIEENPTPYQGLAGHMPFGLPVYIDGNMPTTATAAGAVTAGTNDLGLVAKWDDCWLFEGALRTRVLPEILSGTLQIRFQVFNYFAFLVRYGQSIAVIQGTGMAAPTAADSSITY